MAYIDEAETEAGAVMSEEDLQNRVRPVYQRCYSIH